MIQFSGISSLFKQIPTNQVTLGITEVALTIFAIYIPYNHIYPVTPKEIISTRGHQISTRADRLEKDARSGSILGTAPAQLIPAIACFCIFGIVLHVAELLLAFFR